MRIGAVLAVSFVACAAGLAWWFSSFSRVRIPSHMLGHHAEEIPELLSAEQSAALMALTKHIGEFRTNAADTSSYATRREHIGEAVPRVNGSCAHPFMVPSADGTLCVLAGRIDIGRHFIRTGGTEGKKEFYETAVSRLLSFGHYLFDLDKHPVVRELFADDRFQRAAKAVCPSQQQACIDPTRLGRAVRVLSRMRNADECVAGSHRPARPHAAPGLRSVA